MVSKEVYKYIAGYEVGNDDSTVTTYPGAFDVFSNYDPATQQQRRRPPTLLIDSDALEYSGQVDAEFKKVFAPEIERFKQEYRIQHPERSAEDIDDADLLREVVNTVGKRDKLGAHVRCVVSVSMLTEGWDANTVTHIVGLRAFGSQLLCEQVAGRALRRREYFLDPKTGKFPPEYAHIIGVPFKLFKPGKAEYLQPPDQTEVRALPERREYEINFPNLVGYRVFTLDAPLEADFSALEDFELDFTRTPARTVLGNPIGPEKRILSLEQALDLREQEVVFWIVQQLLRYRFRDQEGNRDVSQFAALRRIAGEWLASKVKVIGETDPRYRNLVMYWPGEKVAGHIARAIDAKAQAQGHVTIQPISNHYNPEGSTRYVSGRTSKPTYPTKKSHVNVIVADTNTWEQLAAKALDEMDNIAAYVKNAYLNFGIPYVKDGLERLYLPDFIARVKLAGGGEIHLIIEITGMNKDKAEKKWYVEHRWLPAVNAMGTWGRWEFVEVSEDIRTVKNQLHDKIAAIAVRPPEDDREFWTHAQAVSMTRVWNNAEDEIWNDV